MQLYMQHKLHLLIKNKRLKLQIIVCKLQGIQVYINFGFEIIQAAYTNKLPRQIVPCLQIAYSKRVFSNIIINVIDKQFFRVATGTRGSWHRE